MPEPAPRLCPACLAMVVVVLGACDGPGHADPGDGQAPDDASAPSGEILVSAAASLTDAFHDMARAFEAVHPGVRVRLNLAGSSTLRAQILEGAPADVFASADRATMDAVVLAGEVAGEPRVFARNVLRIAVPAGNPAGVQGLADLAREELLVGLCAAEVPCGALARRAFGRAGIEPAPDTEEPDVRALLTKVELGELDAGLTYLTDILAAGDAVEGIPLEAEETVATRYPIAVLAGAPDPTAARAFADFVLSPPGQAILARHGFRAP